MTGASGARTIGLAGLLLLATLGQGGGAPLALLVWHAALVGLLLSSLARNRTGGRLPTAVLIPLGLFLLLTALGATRVPYGYGALLTVMELACCVALALLAAGQGSRLIPVLVPPLLVGGALQSFHGLYQVVLLGHKQPSGTFLNPNHMGLWLSAILLVGLGSARGARRAWVGALSLPILVCAILTGSRGAMAGLIAGGLWLAARRWSSVPRRARAPVVVGVAIILALVAGRQILRMQDYDPFRYHRVKIWTASAGVLMEQPVWGSGPGQFGVAAANLRFPDGEGPLRYDRAFSATHSDLLRLPCELGLPASLALLAALVIAFRFVRRRRRDGKDPPEADAVLAAVLALGVAALVDNPSRWPAVYLLGSVLVGSFLSDRKSAVVAVRSTGRPALAVVLVLFFLVADVAPYLAWREVSRLPQTGSLETGERERLKRAIRLNPIHPGYRLRLAEDLTQDPASWDLTAYADARESAEHAARLQPADAAFRKGLARIEARACRTLIRNELCRARARAQFEGAEALSRYDPALPMELAGFLLDTGDPVGARRAAERALDLEPESVVPRLLLADALADAGSAAALARASRLLEEAGERASEWAGRQETVYGRQLLEVDPAVQERIERKIAASVEAARSLP